MKGVTVIGGPWPERIGCTGRVVARDRDEYPFNGLGKNEVVILLDDDPLTRNRKVHPSWSCVMDRSHLSHEGDE